MAGRGARRVALAAGLLGIVVLGGAGGFGYGMLTPEHGSGGPAAPLLPITLASSPVTPNPPAKVVLPDNSPALRTDDLSYKTRTFEVQETVRSRISVRVPGNWKMTKPDPPTEARFSHPTTRRYIRIEAGFAIRETPTIAMNRKIEELLPLPADQLVKITGRQADEDGNATLTYTHVPERVRRIVMVRWVGRDGECVAVLTVTGLPQDKAALLEVLDRATTSITRVDNPL